MQDVAGYHASLVSGPDFAGRADLHIMMIIITIIIIIIIIIMIKTIITIMIMI